MNPFIAKDDGKYVLFSITFAVVPYVGTWIEMYLDMYYFFVPNRVVPYVGTWIEMFLVLRFKQRKLLSFPTWERG